MSCEAFERWLDEGCAGDGEAAARAHAATCPACAAAWRVAQTLERTLAARPAPAPLGFTERVMARVGPGAVPVPPLTPALPWWVRAAMDPATVAALVAGALMAWGWDGIWALAAAVGRSWMVPAAPWGLSASAWLAIEVAAATLLAMLAGSIFRGVARLAAR